MTPADDSLAIARELIATLPRECETVKAYIFGSRARGDADPLSDLDILVEVPGKVSRSLKNMIRDKAWGLSLKHGLVISPVIVSRENFEHGALAASAFARNIQKEGIEVAA